VHPTHWLICAQVISRPGADANDESAEDFVGDGAAYVPAFTTDEHTDGPLEISSLGFDITPRPPDVTGLSEASADVLLRGETEKPHAGVTADGVAWTDVPSLEGPIVFCCAASGLPVFASEDLVASTTGWPSFERPISEDHVIYRPDGGEREVLCAASRTHLGHAIAEGARLRYCINAAALTVNRIPRPVASADVPPSLENALRRRELSTARFAMGCYWHVQDLFNKCPGVLSTTAGFVSGAEAVELTYDPHVVKYEELVELFFASHDPSAFRAVGEKGPGGKYRCEIYALDDDQRATAETVRARVVDVATPVLSADAPFEPAPAEEQDYYRRRRGDQPEKRPLAALAAMPVKLED
jgi:peptide methionine sulfoxide reductase msrA/msrB